MNDFNILLQKFIDQEITKEELEQLELLASQDPILKKNMTCTVWLSWELK